MRRASALLLACLLGVPIVSCGPASAASEPSAGPGAPASAAANLDHPVVIVLGDSISAGKDLARDEAFPALVAERLAEEGRPVRMINAAESGITSRAGVERLDWLLAQDPDLLVVELGGNDGLRGQPLEAIEENLADILTRARDAGVETMLLGMVLPPNYGPQYTSGFADLYVDLAERFDTVFVPFFMEPVAGDDALNLPDGLHPNADGHVLLAERLLPPFREALDRVITP